MKQNTTQQAEGLFANTEAAYRALHSSHVALQASAGRLFNNTFFGRDAAIESLLLVRDGYDVETAIKVVVALAELQGVRYNRLNNEEPGKIHHELRDFKAWQASVSRKLAFRALSFVWGGSAKRLCTYFTQDATGLFLQLVEQCVEHDGRELLGRTVRRSDGKDVTLAQCVMDAAVWISSKQTACGLIADKRSNPFSLFFHVFEDSLTSYKGQDGRLANVKGSLAFLDVQSVSVSGLLSAARLLDHYRVAADWRLRAESIAMATMKYFWSSKDDFFVGAIEIEDGQPVRTVDSIGVNAGWLLGGSLLSLLPLKQQKQVTIAVVKRLFAKDFLTNAGLRNRSLLFNNQPPGVHSYHGSHTVWPLLTFIVAESLRKAGMDLLAQELDARTINALRLTNVYAEFLIVLPDGTMLDTEKTANGALTKKVGIQMKPEKNIGLSIIASLIIERRLAKKAPVPTFPTPAWVAALEKEVLADVLHITPQTNAYVLQHLLPKAKNTIVSTKKGRRKTAYYLLGQLIH